jgi:hypothetical protein
MHCIGGENAWESVPPLEQGAVAADTLVSPRSIPCRERMHSRHGHHAVAAQTICPPRGGRSDNSVGRRRGAPNGGCAVLAIVPKES